MQLILTGCGYAGKTTLAVEISRWMIREMGVPFVRWHNHFAPISTCASGSWPRGGPRQQTAFGMFRCLAGGQRQS